MDVNAKVKQLEDELKVLKAEIRNVLLDIREVILDRINPLAEEKESAFIRMDLQTTARAMAAEAAMHEAAKATEQPMSGEHSESQTKQTPEATAQEGEEEPAQEEAEAHEEEQETEPSTPSPDGGRASRRARGSQETPFGPTEIPPMYMAYLPPSYGSGSLARWVAEAMTTIGPQQLERVITIHRLWGVLPPNINQALAHLQELLRSSREADPPWLKVMEELEELSSPS